MLKRVEGLTCLSGRTRYIYIPVMLSDIQNYFHMLFLHFKHFGADTLGIQMHM